MSLVLGLAACAVYDAPPCFPSSSALPLDESEGGLSRRTLEWEIDKMPALVDAPEVEAPPSAAFLLAQRDMRTEFWGEAANEFVSIVRGDTTDGRRVRQYAQYDLALCLFRLRYFEEAKRVFKLVADVKNHPRRAEADEWLTRKVCSG